jgi:hypothetical protein
MWRVDEAGVTIQCVNEWIRPYHDPVRLVTGGLAMLGSAFFAFAAVTMVAQWRGTTVIEAGVLVGFAAVWLTFVWRLRPNGAARWCPGRPGALAAADSNHSVAPDP